jgi:hypothetical protein
LLAHEIIFENPSESNQLTIAQPKPLDGMSGRNGDDGNADGGAGGSGNSKVRAPRFYFGASAVQLGKDARPDFVLLNIAGLALRWQRREWWQRSKWP